VKRWFRSRRSIATPQRSIDPMLLDRRTPYHDESVPFVLLWSQKSGCTTLLTWFLAHAGQLDAAVAYGRWVHDYEREVMLRRPAQAEHLRDWLESGVPAFKLVRDPYQRAVSSYLSLLEIPDGATHDTLPMRAAIRRMVYGTDDVGYSFSFRQFLAWLETQDIDLVDDHLASQLTALDAEIDDLEYLRLESLADDLAAVERRFGLDHVDLGSLPQPPHHVQRSAHRFADASAIADLQPRITIAEGPPLPHADDFLAPDVVASIERIYAADFAAFGHRRRSDAANATDALDVANATDVADAPDAAAPA
jgi:hypothetical protein